MINVITDFGTSFKGLTAYLLHDVDHADTSERVAWTHTHNLATDDPERASRIMAATAMQQSELKRSSGIKNTGRKSAKHVMHYVLSWAADEHGEYSKEDMIDAALASMTYIGAKKGERIGKKRVALRTQYADEHQAVIVCHDEPGKKPHVHVMVNRVHPEHGVMVTDSKDFEKLSAWALDYRRAEGKEHLCPARVKNAAKRAQGLLTSHPRKARNVYERDQEIVSADPGSRKRALLEQQARRAKELKSKTETMKAKQATEMHALEDQHIKSERIERAKSAEMIRTRKVEIKAQYAPKIDELTDRHASEIKAFNEAKDTATGHVRNTWEAFKTKEWMTDIRTNPLGAMKHGFGLAFSSGMQQRDIEKHHAQEHADLRADRRSEERLATREVRADEGSRLDELRTSYTQQRNDLVLEHRMDKAKLSAEWNQLDRDRHAAASEDGRAPTKSQEAAPTPSGGTQQETKTEASLTGQYSVESSERQPVEPSYDIPIDKLRNIAEELRQQKTPQQDQDRDAGDLDQGISR